MRAVGEISDAFANLTLADKAAVRQNFLLPLLQLLGYAHENELVPTQGVDASSDFIVAQGKAPIAVAACVAPQERLEGRLGPLLEHYRAAGVARVLITNGRETRLYDGSVLLFAASTIEELDASFLQLQMMLGSANVALQHRELAIPITHATATAKRSESANVQFRSYLEHVRGTAAAAAMLPPTIAEALAGQPVRVSSSALLQVAHEREPKAIKDALASTARTLLVGESGIGKTTLLQEMLEQQALRCLSGTSTAIPVFLRLGEYERSRPLYQHISDALAVGGVDVLNSDVRVLLREGRLSLLLDAYDEVFADELQSLRTSLIALLRDYPQCPVILTTRSLRKPAVALPESQLIQLSEDSIERFVSAQLDGLRATAFMNELRSKRLIREASNTLLLTLMILLFARDGALPRTRRLILDAVLDKVAARESDKGQRFQFPLPWPIVERFVSKLAYETFVGDGGYQLERRRTDEVLRQVIGEAEKLREIPGGLPLDKVLEQLVATGFISLGPAGIVFWHRAIMEHFASREAARRIDASSLNLTLVAGEPRWYATLPAAAAQCGNPNAAVSTIAARNVFMAARCGLECSELSAESKKRITTHLTSLCESPFADVRSTALAYLRALYWEEATGALEHLLGVGPGDVQAEVLHELAIRNPAKADELATQSIKWNPSEAIDGLSPDIIPILVLGESTSEDAQDRVMDIWSSQRNIFAGYVARTVLLRFHAQERITKRTMDRLVKLALAEDDEMTTISRQSNAATILAAFKDVDATIRVIEALRTPANLDSWELAPILRSTRDAGVRQLIFDSARDSSLSPRQREVFARALAEMDSIPADWYRELFRDTDARVRAFALSGLRGQPFDEISDLLEEALALPQPAVRREGQDYEYLQACAIEVLASTRRLSLLLDPAWKPPVLFVEGARRLMAAVSEQRLVEFAPAVKRFEDWRVPWVEIRAYFCSAELGDADAVRRLCERIASSKPEERITYEVTQNLHRLVPEQAAQVMSLLWQKVTLGTATTGVDHEHCVEAMQRLGLRDELKQAAAWSVENDVHHVEAERAVRALIGVVDRRDEDWLLDLIHRLSQQGSGGFALRRALEVAGMIGHERSIETLTPFLDDKRNYMRNSAFWAIKTIHERTGRVWYRGLENSVALVPEMTSSITTDRWGLAQSKLDSIRDELRSLVDEILLGAWFHPRIIGWQSVASIARDINGHTSEQVKVALDAMAEKGLLEKTSNHPDFGEIYEATRDGWNARELILRGRGRRCRAIIEQRQFPLSDLILALAMSDLIESERPVDGNFLEGETPISVAEIHAVLGKYEETEIDVAIAKLLADGMLVGTTTGAIDEEVPAVVPIGTGEQAYRQRIAKTLGLRDDESPLDERLELAAVHAAVCVIESEDHQAQGTAFAIGPRLFATCEHCVYSDTHVFSAKAVSVKAAIEVVARDAVHDLVVFRADLDVPHLSLSEEASIEDRHQYLAIGFPRYQLGDSTQSYPLSPTGTRNFHGVRLALVTGGILAGMSGSPVLNDRREVVGMAMRGGKDADEAARDEFQAVLGISELRHLLEQNGIHTSLFGAAIARTLQ